MRSDPDVLMVFGTIMVAISSTMSLIAVNMNQQATQSMEIGSFSCLIDTEISTSENLSRENMNLSLGDKCEELLKNSIDAKRYSSLSSDFSILWLLVGVGFLLKAAIEYHRDGRLAPNFHFR